LLNWSCRCSGDNNRLGFYWINPWILTQRKRSRIPQQLLPQEGMEFLSHLPSTSPSANPLRPTLFELIAQDQLRDLIQPALRYIVAVPSLPFLHPLILVLCSTTPTISFEICNMVRRILCRTYVPCRPTFPPHNRYSFP
jgi:hypothetical protein